MADASSVPSQAGAAAGWRRSLARSNALLQILVVVLVAVAIFSAYFTIWVLSRDAYFTTRNFRILAGLGKQIESIIAVQSDGLRYGALGQLAEPARSATEVSISYRDSPDAPRRMLLAGGAPTERKETKPEQDAGRPLLGFEAYPEGAYLKTTHVKVPRRLKLEPLIDPILARDVFAHVMVADGNGNVLFEEESREIRLTSLLGLLKARSGDGGPLHGRQATVRVRNVDVSGVGYELFISPLRVPVAREKDNEGAGPWLVCGLVRSDIFQEESLALPRRPLICFVLLIVVILLCWPLIKLVAMQGWEHLSRLDLVWLVTSLFLIPALMTLAIWGGWRFHMLHGLWDRTLRGIGDQIAMNFRADVHLYQEALAEADRSFSRGGAGEGPTLASRSALDRLPFNDFSWVRNDGCQAYKISFGSSKPMIDVHDREYFQSLARDVHPTNTARASLSFVEPVNSWTTGEPELVVALKRRDDAEIPIAAVATPLPSLIDAVLPPGFEYAVVQNRREVQGSPANPRIVEVGDVLLHSDKRRNLRENLLQETTDSAWLSADLMAETSAWGSLVYQGQARRAYVRPLAIADRPWSIVVLADEDLLTSFDLQVASGGLAPTCLYGLLVGLLFFAYSRLRGADWLWPKPEGLPAYAHLIGLLLAVVLINLYVFVVAGASSSLWLMALVPVALLGGIHQALGRPLAESARNLRIVATLEILLLASLAVLCSDAPGGVSLRWLLVAATLAGLVATSTEIGAFLHRGLAALRDPWRTGPSTRWRWSVERPGYPYLVFLVLGGLVLAVLPTIVFFDIAFDSQMDVLAQQTLREVGGSLQERERRLAKDLGSRVSGASAGRAATPSVTGQGTAAAVRAAISEGQCAGASEPYLPTGGAVHQDDLASRFAGWLDFERRRHYATLLFDTCVCYDDRSPRGLTSCSCRDAARLRAVARAGGCPRGAAAGRGVPSASSPAEVPASQTTAWQVRSYATGDGPPCYELPIAGGVGTRSSMVLVTHAPADDLAPTDLGQALVLCGAALLAAGIFFLVVRFVTSMLFFQDLTAAPPGVKRVPPLHLALDRSELPALEPPPPGSGWRLLDLREMARAALDRRFSHEDEDRVIVIDHFDSPGDAAASAREIVLRATAGRRLILFCDHLAAMELAKRREEEPVADAAPLGMVLTQDGDALQVPTPEELRRRVSSDYGLLSDVEALERWSIASGGDERQILAVLSEAMRPVYQLRWAGLGKAPQPEQERTQEEKEILRAIVHRQLITAKAGRRLRRLAAAGFITQDPGLRVVSLSQGIFIRDQTAREIRESPVHLAKKSEWTHLKMPLSASVVLLLVFLFMTQRELFDNAVAMIGAFGGGLAAMTQLFSNLGSGKHGKRHD